MVSYGWTREQVYWFQMLSKFFHHVIEIKWFKRYFILYFALLLFLAKYFLSHLLQVAYHRFGDKKNAIMNPSNVFEWNVFCQQCYLMIAVDKQRLNEFQLFVIKKINFLTLLFLLFWLLFTWYHYLLLTNHVIGVQRGCNWLCLFYWIDVGFKGLFWIMTVLNIFVRKYEEKKAI